MKILYDTNIVLDVLLLREPHFEASAGLLSLAETGRIDGVVGATTITTIHYLATRAVGRREARRHVETLLSIFTVAPVDGAVLSNALGLDFDDFEDGVLHEAARAVGAEGVVTRDTAGFQRARLRVYEPEVLLTMVRSLGA